ncbi:MAG: SRPBCC family protein [Acidimicrobiales bacterium]
MRIEHTIEIAAPVERVWDLTIDVESWPEHTPTITSVERLDDGPFGLGSRARIKQPAQGAKEWTVTAFEPNVRFAWATKLAGQSLTGGHELRPSAQGTINTLTLDLDGPLAFPIGLLIRRPIAKAIATENAGFKAAAEQST